MAQLHFCNGGRTAICGKPYPSLSGDKIGKFGAAGANQAGWLAFVQSEVRPGSITGNYERSCRLPEGEGADAR